MTDLTAYIELAEELEAPLDLKVFVPCTIKNFRDREQAAKAIRSLVERVRELEQTADILIDDLIRARKASAALASQEASTAPKALPPIGESGS